MMLNDHTVRAFDTDIAGMRSAIMIMGGLVEKQVADAVKAICESSLLLITEVLHNEDSVNRLHLQVDLLCNQILAKRQPLAIDLREVLAAIHSINDLERIGDEAKKIALKARDMGGVQLNCGFPLEEISAMGAKVCGMLRVALDAFIRHDPQVAASLIAEDREIDALRDQLRGVLMRLMSENSKQIAVALDMVFVVQSLERVGDHAKSLAQYVVTVVEGRDTRHGSLAS